ncbi:histidine kinase [Emticicia sp. BO119]|nr:histidine kinase [Emticicia sp. BO119]
MLIVSYTSCVGQNKTNPPPDNVSKGLYTEAYLKEAETLGVPMSMVRHVKQARNGDILIASFLGVFRYNGKSFTNLTNKISPPRFSSFWDVLEDRKGNLWFGSRDSGVYYYNPKQVGGEAFQHFTTKDGLASNMVLHIYEDKAGYIWFGASRYDPARRSDSTATADTPVRADGKYFRNFTTEDGFPTNSIRLLLEDKTGKLWFCAQGEDMFVYDPSAAGGKAFTVLKNKDGKPFNNVWSIIEDKKGNIWFGADGLWRFDGSTFTKVSDRGAYAIIQDKKGNIWTTGGVNPNGNIWALSRYDSKTLYDKEPTVTEIMSQPVMLLGILEDAEGNIWFGSGGGVYRYDGKTITDFKEGQK